MAWDKTKKILARFSVVVGIFASPGAIRAAQSGSASVELPRVNLSAARVSPVVDGNLNDACWQMAATVDRFHLVKSPGKTAPQKIWLTYDPAWLYLAFALPHPTPRELKCNTRKTNGKINDDESLELFLDPGTDGEVYFHLMLNADNVHAQKCVARDIKRYVCIHDIQWRSATAITSNGWNAEVAVPLALLAKSGDITRLRMNLARNQVLPVMDASNARVDETVEWSTWSPVNSGFHEPERFGFVWDLPAAATGAFFPRINRLQVMPYASVSNRYVYAVQAEIAEPHGQTGSVELAVMDYPALGVAATATTVFAVTGRAPQAVAVQVPVSAPAKRAIRVALRDTASGEEFHSEWLEGEDLRNLELLQAYPDLSSYSGEKQADVAVSVNVPAADYSALQLNVLDVNGHSLAQSSVAGKETTLAVPVSDLKPGLNIATVQLTGNDGGLIARQDVWLVRRDSESGVAWKTDRRNGTLLQNGKPFFPFGLICVPGSWGKGDADLEAAIGDIAGAGFNTIVEFSFNLQPEKTRALLALAGQAGLAVIDNLDGYHAPEAASLLRLRGKVLHGKGLSKPERQAMFDAGYQSNLPYIVESIATAKTNQALMGYCTLDEPNSGDSVDMYRWGRQIYRKTIETDGTHPTFLNFSSYIPPGDEWVDWCDVLLTDPYWWPAGKVHRGTPNYVSKITWLTVERARRIHKPAMIIPMAETWGCNPKRQINPAEQYCQTYLALIHGAKGLFYFAYPLYHQAVFQALSELAGQIKKMEPALLAPPPAADIVYEPAPGDPARGAFPDVQVRICRHPEDGWILLAANSRNYPVKTVYSMDGLKTNAMVERLFDDAKYPVSQNAFSEILPPYATRAYMLPLAVPVPGAPVKVAVSMIGYPDQAVVEEPAIPVTGRPERKNILPNPGFEKTTLPGMPDYVWPFRLTPPNCRWGMAEYPMALDTSNPYEGKYCFRMEARERKTGVHLKLAPAVEQPEPFVFSAYMRGDSSNARVSMPTVYWGWESPSICLTTNWRRYVIKGNMPPGLTYNAGVRFFSLKGTVWVDAMQLESGMEATDYEP